MGGKLDESKAFLSINHTVKRQCSTRPLIAVTTLSAATIIGNGTFTALKKMRVALRCGWRLSIFVLLLLSSTIYQGSNNVFLRSTWYGFMVIVTRRAARPQSTHTSTNLLVSLLNADIVNVCNSILTRINAVGGSSASPRRQWPAWITICGW